MRPGRYILADLARPAFKQPVLLSRPRQTHYLEDADPERRRRACAECRGSAPQCARTGMLSSAPRCGSPPGVRGPGGYRRRGSSRRRCQPRRRPARLGAGGGSGVAGPGRRPEDPAQGAPAAHGVVRVLVGQGSPGRGLQLVHRAHRRRVQWVASCFGGPALGVGNGAGNGLLVPFGDRADPSATDPGDRRGDAGGPREPGLDQHGVSEPVEVDDLASASGVTQMGVVGGPRSAHESQYAARSEEITREFRAFVEKARVRSAQGQGVRTRSGGLGSSDRTSVFVRRSRSDRGRCGRAEGEAAGWDWRWCGTCASDGFRRARRRSRSARPTCWPGSCSPAPAGLADGTISSDIGHLEQVRTSGGAQIRREPAMSACCGCSAVCGLPVAPGTNDLLTGDRGGRSRPRSRHLKLNWRTVRRYLPDDVVVVVRRKKPSRL